MPPRAASRPAEVKLFFVLLVVCVLSTERVSGIQEDNKLPEVQQPAEVTSNTQLYICPVWFSL